MSDPGRARMWQFGGRWYAQVLDAPMFVEVTGTSRAGCLAELRKIAGDDATLTVEIVPDLVWVAEAAEIVGWDKRRIITYIDRGHFPRPLQALASGRVWVRSDVEDYADSWRAKQAARKRQQQP